MRKAGRTKAKKRASGAYLGSPARRRGPALARGVFARLAFADAPALTGAVPEVDRLAVRVVTDSYHHYFAASGEAAGVKIERYVRPPSMDEPRTLKNEWGLALHLESARRTETRQVMIDFGFTAETLNANLELLGIEPAKLDALLLTHGHYDHFGGMAGFFAAYGAKGTKRARLRKGVPFYLGGEECFCVRETGPVATPSNFGALSRRAIKDAGVRVLYAGEPSLVADHGISTGWIGLVSFEKPAQPSRMRVGMLPDGSGCAPERLPEEKRSVEMLPDDFQHEHALVFHVRGKGLVVLTSCGHRGVVNSVRAAMKVSGISKIHAVLGGFHLAPMPTDYVRQTVVALKELEPDVVIPMHCSGPAFYEIAKQEMPGRVLLSSTGTRFVFGG